ncbi:MAG: hypothetical protein R6V37_08720 [Psychroflexus maritimus]
MMAKPNTAWYSMSDPALIEQIGYTVIKNTTTGVIAQELKEIFPEFVHQDEENEYMGVNYAGLSVVAIKALQEQQTEIEELKAKINTQNKNLEEIEELKAKNKALEEKFNTLVNKVEFILKKNR